MSHGQLTTKSDAEALSLYVDEKESDELHLSIENESHAIEAQSDSEATPRETTSLQQNTNKSEDQINSNMLLNDPQTIASRGHSLLNPRANIDPLPSKHTRLVSRSEGSHAYIQPEGQMRKLSYFYHEILDIPWPRLLFFFFCTFAIFNMLFATVFWAIDGVTDGTNRRATWFDAFNFTLQSMDTIGYGQFLPQGHGGNAWVFFTSFFANTYWALVTGLVFAKLSRPSRLKRTVKFSNVAVINQETDYFECESHDLLEHGEYRQGDYDVLSFRFGLMRVRSRMCDTMCTVMVFERKTMPDGYEDYSYTEVDFELNRQQSGRTRTMEFSSPLLTLPVVIAHRIDETSPLYGLTTEDIIRRKMEVICVIDWIDEATSDNCQVWFSYVGDEILFNHRFVPMVRSVLVMDQDIVRPERDFEDATTEMTLTQENYDPYADGNEIDDFDRGHKTVAIRREKLIVDYDRISFTRPILDEASRFHGSRRTSRTSKSDKKSRDFTSVKSGSALRKQSLSDSDSHKNLLS